MASGFGRIEARHSECVRLGARSDEELRDNNSEEEQNDDCCEEQSGGVSRQTTRPGDKGCFRHYT